MLKKLWLAYRQWYVKYLGLQNRKNETDRLSYYRDQLFISIFTLTMVLGSISYFPSIIAAIILDKWFVLYADTIAILVLFFGFLYKNLSLENRKVIYSTTFLVLSFGLVYDLGLGGNGTVLLFMLSILITLYSSTRSGINSIIITAVFYLTLILIKYFNIINIKFFVEGPLEGLIIVFINNIIFCLLTVYAVSFLIQQLHKAFIKENELQQMLKKEHNKTIKAKNEAEQSNKLKTAFLSNMSHEIKTPLYGITGSAQLLKSDLQLDKTNNKYFQIIESNSKLLLNVFNDILEISQLETGNISIDIANVNISDLLDDIKSEFTGKVQEKDIQFSTTINFKTNKIFRTDQDKLHKALNHIIDNAIKFSPKNAIVNISCIPLDDETLQFKISDNGIGISDIHIDKVHLPFFTIDLENKTGTHGAGLGLSIAKSYIELLGGKFQIESEVNKGTTVIFQLNNL